MGVTALGKANHAQKGSYIQALFGLSVGIERVSKLILVAEHATENGGAWLANAELRKKGHEISASLTACELISGKLHKDNDFWVDPTT